MNEAVLGKFWAQGAPNQYNVYDQHNKAKNTKKLWNSQPESRYDHIHW